MSEAETERSRVAQSDKTPRSAGEPRRRQRSDVLTQSLIDITRREEQFQKRYQFDYVRSEIQRDMRLLLGVIVTLWLVAMAIILLLFFFHGPQHVAPVPRLGGVSMDVDQFDLRLLAGASMLLVTFFAVSALYMAQKSLYRRANKASRGQTESLHRFSQQLSNVVQALTQHRV